MRPPLTLLLGFFISFPTACHAWGTEGHATIGAIADANLNPAARARVALLLQDDLDATDTPSGRTTLAAVASWADEIKAIPQGKEAANWHFHESTVCDGRTLPCVNGACVDEKISEMGPRLKNPVLPANFTAGTPSQWMDEGQQFIKSTVYTFSGFACGAALPDAPVVLSPEYQRAAKAVIFPQIMKAGWRLAAVLNQALK